ncbi:unnamed protein product [Knipowitschia caucasica]
MREAMAVAQSTATKQLQRHTDLYNKKVRGAPVEVEDRVLLANKGERGKRKLADRWENTVYVVVEKNDESHTFKIQNPISGQIKVVHRNLIMPVNFLPLMETESGDPDGDVLSPVSSSVDLSRSAVTEESTKSAEFRTRAWVSGLPSDTGSVTSVEDSVLENAVPLDEPESDAMDSSLPRAPDLETAMAPDFDMTDVPAAASAEAVTDRRSRAGRLLRPVTRFVEIMHQKPVSTL